MDGRGSGLLRSFHRVCPKGQTDGVAQNMNQSTGCWSVGQGLGRDVVEVSGDIEVSFATSRKTHRKPVPDALLKIFLASSKPRLVDTSKLEDAQPTSSGKGATQSRK